MNTSNLIPFALNDHGLMVSVEDVPSGAACGCICPSCNTPLIARKGQINRAHFAHDGHQQNADTFCSYTPERSVELMILAQLKEPGQVIHLPDYFLNNHQITSRKSWDIEGVTESQYDGAIIIKGTSLDISFHRVSQYQAIKSKTALLVLDVAQFIETLQPANYKLQIQQLIEKHHPAKCYAWHKRQTLPKYACSKSIPKHLRERPVNPDKVNRATIVIGGVVKK